MPWPEVEAGARLRALPGVVTPPFRPPYDVWADAVRPFLLGLRWTRTGALDRTGTSWIELTILFEHLARVVVCPPGKHAEAPVPLRDVVAAFKKRFLREVALTLQPEEAEIFRPGSAP